ncbi:hypothetical protein TSUD_127690 [Trifolium subterraneum]|nr:hypothetical protein TSUD_127690 [Trifolium subterraneum]
MVPTMPCDLSISSTSSIELYLVLQMMTMVPLLGIDATLSSCAIEKTTKRTLSLNWPKGAKARKVTAKFISCNPFFTILIKPYHLVKGQLRVPSFKGVIVNKEKYVKLQIGKRSWNVKLLHCHGNNYGRHLSAGWRLFVCESGLQSGDQHFPLYVMGEVE